MSHYVLLHGYITAIWLLIIEYASNEDRVCLLKEMSMMRDVGRHPAIVSMLACSTSHPFIIMDYCAKGDLKSYLQQLREDNSEITLSAFSYGSKETQGL